MIDDLHLTLKKKWFDMISQNIKLEEYREIKPYWEKRLKKYINYKKPFNIIFRNGYSKLSPVIKKRCAGIRIDNPRPEWSDGVKEKCFVLGELSDG